MDEEQVTSSELSTRIARLTLLTQEIEHSDAWAIAMQEIEALVNQLDENWQALTADAFEKARTQKMGLMAVLNVVNDWKDELAALEKDLFALENPDKVQDGDYDGETQLEQE